MEEPGTGPVERSGEVLRAARTRPRATELHRRSCGGERTLSVLNRTPRIATPVVVHNLQLIPTRDPRHTMLAATQIAAIRSLILLAKDGER